MKEIVDHHHYNLAKNNIEDRVSIYEKYVIDELLHSPIPDIERESSVSFEIMHHRGCAQFARVLSRKRKLPLDVCTVGALLHDIYVIKTGKYFNHAENGIVYAKDIMENLGMFSLEEKAQIIDIIKHHSSKEIFSDNPFAEFGKDVDVLDSFLYPNAFAYYLKHKKLAIFNSYVIRAKKIWAELGIPDDISFSVLDNYKKENWLDYCVILEMDKAKQAVSYLLYICQKASIPIPTFLIAKKEKFKLFINTLTYKRICDSCGKDEITFFDDLTNFYLLDNSSAESLFSVLTEVDSAVVVWGELGMYEKHSTEDLRVFDFIAKNNI